MSTIVIDYPTCQYFPNSYSNTSHTVTTPTCSQMLDNIVFFFFSCSDSRWLLPHVICSRCFVHAISGRFLNTTSPHGSGMTIPVGTQYDSELGSIAKYESVFGYTSSHPTSSSPFIIPIYNYEPCVLFYNLFWLVSERSCVQVRKKNYEWIGILACFNSVHLLSLSSREPEGTKKHFSCRSWKGVCKLKDRYPIDRRGGFYT